MNDLRKPDTRFIRACFRWNVNHVFVVITVEEGLWRRGFGVTVRGFRQLLIQDLLPDLLVPVDVVGCESHAREDIRHPFEQTPGKDVHEA
jgi:hypothetical protein